MKALSDPVGAHGGAPKEEAHGGAPTCTFRFVLGAAPCAPTIPGWTLGWLMWLALQLFHPLSAKQSRRRVDAAGTASK